MKSFFNKLRKPSAACCVFLYLFYFVTAVYCHCVGQSGHNHHQVAKNEAPHGHSHEHCHSSPEKSTSRKHPLCDCHKFEVATLASSSQPEITKIYSSLVILQDLIPLLSSISSPQQEWQTIGFHGPPGHIPLYVQNQSFLI